MLSYQQAQASTHAHMHACMCVRMRACSYVCMSVYAWALLEGSQWAISGIILRSHLLCVLRQSLALGPGITHESGWASGPVSSGDLLSLPP